MDIMARRFSSALLLTVFGAAGGLISVVAVTQIGDSPPERLAIGLALILSGVLLLLGLVRVYGHETGAKRTATLPAKILLVIGLCTAIGGIAVFEPWRADVSQGFRMIITGIWVFVGSGLTVAGRHWEHQQESRYPLAVLLTGQLLSLFYVVFESVDSVLPPIPTPALLLLGTIAGIPVLWVLYHQPATDTR
ncbi:uncharacterized protein HVO_C0015 (plasmid) [Haloferax volcanii DS2]|uniref:Uncharacterized protein n=2 Tax=Haloferax volcanii TaxID=2246 RepID=D4H0A5_HALVD|nr:uncharacterized protein HVO_C0015 [Haloferax volcanii DS2]